MAKTGLVLTTPGGTRFWHPCADPAEGFKQMESIAFTYGAAWGHKETSIEFAEDAGTEFKVLAVVKAADKPAAGDPVATAQQLAAKAFGIAPPVEAPAAPVETVSPGPRATDAQLDAAAFGEPLDQPAERG